MVLPELQALGAEREIRVECIVPEELPDEGGGLDRRLQMIEAHRPLVVAFLGQRAGPVESITPELISRYPSLPYYAPKGCQEIELSFAESYADQVFFYSRDPAFLSSVPQDERPHYLPADGDEAARAAVLVHRLHSSGRLLVDGYSFDWPARDVPAVALRELAQRLLADLSTAIEERASADRHADRPTEQFPQRTPEITGSVTLPSMTLPKDAALPFHEDVQFTVYRPRVARPFEWTPVLAFAHLGAAPLGSDPSDDPIRQVEQRARAVLGDRTDTYSSVRQDSSVGLPEEAELTFVLDLQGFDVKAPRRTFLWVNAVHMEEFQVRAGTELNGRAGRGSLQVYHGSILIAEVRLAIQVDARVPSVVADNAVSAKPFRKIFPSYSHLDTAIVEEFEAYAEATGDRYLRDVRQLRSGELWSARLREFIHESDVFQLFWSHNAMKSRYVEQEWRYALALCRPNFVRPTYWEEPMPAAPGLPPDELRQIHFHLIGRSASRQQPPGATTTMAPPTMAPPPPRASPPMAAPQYAPQPPYLPPMPPPQYSPPGYGAPPPVGLAPPPPMASMDYAADGRRRLWPWLLLAAMVIAIVVAIVIALTI